MDAAQQDAYIEAAEELGTSIAIGLVPALGQAIDIYDTLESAWRLYGAEKSEAKDEAKFDMVLSLIGWIPGPGDGVKKSLRLVNKNPQRFAPILFDLLRKVLEISGVETSPEALLEKLFNASGLQAQLKDVQSAIEDSEIYQSFSPENRERLKFIFSMVRTQLPSMIGIVERRLLKWKAVQTNSSAKGQPHGKIKTDKPAKKDGTVATHGQQRGASTVSNASLKSVVAAEVTKLASDVAGVLGEHITDYHCAEVLGWGSGWQGHDKGSEGKWSGSAPGTHTEGKLSNKTHLFKLGLEANGQGIDAVWRAKSNNGGKPYAIVEAKSEVDLLKQMPSYLKKDPKSKRQPSIAGKLGVNGIPKAEELLEPYADNGAAGKPMGGGKPAGKPNKSSGPKTKQKVTSDNSRRDNAQIFVQMSHEWIEKNLVGAVGKAFAIDIGRKLPSNQKNYSRHLFYVAMWTDSAREHAKAVLNGVTADASTHADHALPSTVHYQDAKVKEAVNQRKTTLRKKYGNLPSLQAEA